MVQGRTAPGGNSAEPMHMAEVPGVRGREKTSHQRVLIPVAGGGPSRVSQGSPSGSISVPAMALTATLDAGEGSPSGTLVNRHGSRGAPHGAERYPPSASHR